jgi:hypothetical protein
VSKASAREIARLGQISDDTARKNLLYLSNNTDLVSTIETEDDRGLILKAGSGPWVNLDIDHPAWGLNPLDFCVYLALKRFNGPKGCIVTNATISEFLFTTPRNIKDSMHSLKTIGAIAPHCQAARLNTGNWTQKRRIIIQNKDLWKKQAEKPVSEEPQKASPMYLEDAFSGGQNEPQKASPMYLEDAFSGGQNEPQKASIGAVKSVRGVPQKASPDLESDLESEKNQNTHTAHARTHEAEHQTPAGVCVLDKPSEPKPKTPAERFLAKIEWTLNSKVRSVSARANIEEAIISAWNQNGYISEKFVIDCFSVVNKETLYPDKVVIKKISEWAEFSQKIRDKMMEPNEIEARDLDFWPMTEDEQKILSVLDDHGRRYLIDCGYAQEINRIWWILRDSHHWIKDAITNAREYSEEKLRKAKDAQLSSVPPKAPGIAPPKPREKTPEEIQADKNRRKASALRDLEKEKESKVSDAVDEYTKQEKHRIGQLKSVHDMECELEKMNAFALTLFEKYRAQLEPEYEQRRLEIEAKYA